MSVFWARVIALLSLGLSPTVLFAEVTLDGSLGSSGAIPLNTEQTYLIDSSQGKISGGNLFHSFARFNVETGTTAHFTDQSQSAIHNVIARVTGDTASTIDGTIKSSVAHADFYLINPAGLIFGENAQLDVPASFYASGATQLNMADGTAFPTTSASSPVLTAASPQSFGFLEQTGDIQINGLFLSVYEGYTQHYSGRDVVLKSATLNTDAGRVELFAAGNNTVIIPGQINHAEGLLLFDSSNIYGNTTDLASSQVLLNAKTINMVNTISADLPTGIQLTAAWSDVPHSNPGRISLAAQNISLSGAVIVSAENYSSNPDVSGGDIDIQANTFSMSKAARLSAKTNDNGKGGRIDLYANDSIKISDMGTVIYSGTSSIGSGYSGNIKIITPEFSLADNAVINGDISGQGQGGSIIFQSDNINLHNKSLINLSSYGKGVAGNIIISPLHNAQAKMQMASGSIINADAWNNSKPGTIDISLYQLSLNDSEIRTNIFGNYHPASAYQSMILDIEHLSVYGKNATISARTDRDSTGRGGTIQINSKKLNIGEHAVISTESLGSGDAGNIVIKTNQLKIKNDGHVTASSQSSGLGGTVAIESKKITLNNDAQIAAFSNGTADAGQILINEKTRGSQLAILNDSQITVQSESGNAGDIDINEKQQVYLLDSQITTSAAKGLGNGGNIRIDPKFVILNDSKIIANAVQGHGGNIDIISNFFMPSTDSLISASSQFGLQGSIAIQSQYANIANSIAVLKGKWLDTSNRLNNSCNAEKAHLSSFVVNGRGTLPLTPDAPLYFSPSKECDMD